MFLFSQKTRTFKTVNQNNLKMSMIRVIQDISRTIVTNTYT